MNNRRIVTFLWIVIAFIIVAAGIGGGLMYKHASDLEQSNFNLTGDNQSLKSQLKQAKATPTPTPTAAATPVVTPAPTVAPKATATPKPTATPKGSNL